MKKIIITGPTGTVGQALVRECLNQGDEVYVICRPDSKRSKTLPVHNRLHIVQADLRKLDTAKEQLPHDCNVFYHLAWLGTDAQENRYNVAIQEQNIRYTLEAVDLAHECGCTTFIGAGSQAEYGRFEGKLTADTSCFPDNAYGMAKLCAGQMTKLKAHQYGMCHIWPRILSVYGPYDGKQTLVISVILQLLRGEVPKCTKGEQLWDFLYAGDAAGILYALAERGKDGKVYCVGRGEAKPLKEYILQLRNAINPSLKVDLGAIPYSTQQVMYLCVDNTDIIQEIGYKYQYDFTDGIKNTIAWCKKYLIPGGVH